MQCSRCRAALPAGSLFCNACGTPVSAGGSAQPPQPAAPQPTQAYPPTQAYQPPTQPYQPHVTQQLPNPAALNGEQQYAAAPPMPGKRPVVLLSALVSIVVVGVVAGGIVMWRNSQPSVISAGAPAQPSGPGVTQTASSELPQAPAVVASQPAPPPRPGAPVTASEQKPDDSVPSMLMAPGSQAPQGSSVTTVQTPSIPAGPPVLQVPNQPARPAQPVTAAPSRQTPPPPQAAAPAPRNNADFDRYIQWLRYVEQERGALRAAGETESFRMIEQFYGMMLGFADPDSNDAQMQAQFDQNLQNTLRRTLAAVSAFRNNIVRSKPAVPSDCKALDSYYMAAVDEESRQTVALMEALTRKDIGNIRRIGSSGVGRIDQNLGMANKQLEKAYEGRGLNQQFTIQTGGNSSMLGGLVGLGAR